MGKRNETITYRGEPGQTHGRFAIVASRFNQTVVDQLVRGAIEGLLSGGVKEKDIDLVHVPGAFEIPLTAKRLASSQHYAAIICLGAVIRGETDHYDYVSKAATDGVLHAGLETGVPVIFGVLTCDTEEQALSGAGPGGNNKGREAALAAIEMASLFNKLPKKE